MKFIFENKENKEFCDLTGDNMRHVMDSIQELDSSGRLHHFVCGQWLPIDGFEGDLCDNIFRVLTKTYTTEDALEGALADLQDFSHCVDSLSSRDGRVILLGDVKDIVKNLAASLGDKS